MEKLDRIDRRILELLQQDARISIAELADAVGLSPTPCGRRVKQLESRGLIARQIVVLDPKKIGLPMTILVQISLEKQTKDRLKLFEEAVALIPEVMECYLITGSQSDYMLKMVTRDLDHYQQLLLDKLAAIEGVNSIISNFIMRQPVHKTAYDLEHLSR
ncbi:Lrp/AsnC family transcriptional regulator [Motiliproteus coralliicola]|uniref:Lrp/AsnC family transcriptional regulator n=1 Tax=Motiliproteus coralliicola TaxID=2283196 RepID=A0A369WN57_9GAMM|nr:Lrp/AsnC family transcriptional regulator [Motiliproteus coralliicola]RDE22931.1 Lrp/AsnC family transcriptional regulator [Motiliproteus coralliicola]